MHLRSLVIMGLCAAVGMASPAFAEAPAPAKSFLFGATKTATADDAAKPGAKNAKNKKLTAKQKAKADALAKAKAKEDAKIAAKEKAAADKLAAKAKADAARKLAEKAKAVEDAKIAKAKAQQEKAKALADARMAKAKAAQEAKLAKAQALADAKAEKARAMEAQRLARIQAEEDRRAAEDQRRKQELVQLAALPVATEGNNGELRSDIQVQQQQVGFFQALFGGGIKQQSSILPETRALDAALELKQEKKKFKVRPEYEPQRVDFSGYPTGTIVIDTDAHFLYLVESSSSARRYGIAVGKEGLQYKGTIAVGDKQEWPRWIPTQEMQKRDPKKYGRYKDGMPGGGQNPLGARAIYLYDGKKDTHLRIHGTIAPESIGTNASNGCFRMVNEHVMDLYRRVGVGTKVVVM